MRSEFLALCDEVDLPKDMQEYDKETGRFKYRTASVMWLGFSKAWEKRQTEVDELKKENLLLESGQKSLFKQHVELQKRVDACQKLLEKWKTTGLNGTSDYAVGGAHARQNCEDELEQALKGEG